ncbi:MAG: hypothetical protein DHS20C21_19330 [Gemmatimonadota bacterium]|nr:MAG: hypothetical protein DHS20C21_19330 [Gemmatimonadota bacterium]
MSTSEQLYTTVVTLHDGSTFSLEARSRVSLLDCGTLWLCDAGKHCAAWAPGVWAWFTCEATEEAPNADQ